MKKTSTFYFVRQVGQRDPLRRGPGAEWHTEPAQAVEAAKALNDAEKLRHRPGPKVEAVRIEISAL